jgi:predicted dehydrogenase
MTEPLELECKHFLDCIATGATPRTDVTSALDVVRVLEAAQASLDADGAPVTLAR